MPAPPPAYAPRSPSHGVLYQLVREHFETFRAEFATTHEGDGLPRFVDRAFLDFLTCGWLAGGFARFRCDGCGTDRLVPFSCKGRALCPSCGGRRMAERAAHLVDQVLPDVPIRQWVLSLPPRLRYMLAWDHELCRAVAGILADSIGRLLRERARDAGIDGGRSGGVVVIQRFGGALNLNVHLHALVLDGVFARGDDQALAFHRLARLTALDVEEVLATIEPLVARRLRRCGQVVDDDGRDAAGGWADEAPVLAGLTAASVDGVAAVGPRRGSRPVRLGIGREPEAASPGRRWHARVHGFDLDAGLVVPAGRRDWLERVCRYTLRPPVAEERLTLMADGRVTLSLKQPWRDGTTALVFDPVELLGRLAVLVPRPRVNLILYVGVLGARSAWRAEVVPRAGGPDPAGAAGPDRAGDPESSETAAKRARGLTWAALMARTFGFDVLACGQCGGRLRLVALIQETAVIDRILRHLGLPTTIPPRRPARAPPFGAGTIETEWDGDHPAFAPCD